MDAMDVQEDARVAIRKSLQVTSRNEGPLELFALLGKCELLCLYLSPF